MIEMMARDPVAAPAIIRTTRIPAILRWPRRYVRHLETVVKPFPRGSPLKPALIKLSTSFAAEEGPRLGLHSVQTASWGPVRRARLGTAEGTRFADPLVIVKER